LELSRNVAILSISQKLGFGANFFTSVLAGLWNFPLFSTGKSKGVKIGFAFDAELA
jgi:hypothetical protein